jgi:hypothetical protein
VANTGRSSSWAFPTEISATFSAIRLTNGRWRKAIRYPPRRSTFAAAFAGLGGSGIHARGGVADRGGDVDEEEDGERSRLVGACDQAADETAQSETQIEEAALEAPGRVAARGRRERAEEGELGRPEAAAADSNEKRGDDRVPRLADKREEAVADGEQRERGDEGPTRAGAVDDRSDQHAGDEAGGTDRRDDEPGDAEPDAAYVVQVDDEERVRDARAERVDEKAELERPDDAGEPRVQAR